MDVGNGALQDFTSCGGTHTHCRKSGTTFYLHFQTARSYLMPDEVMVQLWVAESTGLKGGQWGRYCSTCQPGIRNDKVSIAGIHIPVALLALRQPNPSIRPTHPPLPLMMTPFAPTIPLEMNSEAIESLRYSGKECAGRRQGCDTGYLPLLIGDHLAILSGAEEGHRMNSFPVYVYCQNTKGSR